MKVLILCLSVLLPALVLADNDCAKHRFARGECAVLFDDSKCGGWKYPVKTGYHELSFRRRNDVESLIVKEGCKFTGYDHDGTTAKERGDFVIVDARNSRRPEVRELKGDKMDERISSLQCFCEYQGRPSFVGK
ncbi:uncharacterized protein LOC131886147 [Tigriopus californicus]|uniref:uncharacterized protein LOC131886147 n=1 Tax=Tigriopus californicus TaxID=6832 RepID=UPI0027DA7159|nr:uncharacterized protein LOC131886147 [Tigriopus californicus]